MDESPNSFFSPAAYPKQLTVEGGEAGAKLIATLNFRVPPRGPLRRNWHREGYCALRLIETLLVMQPHVFPLTLTRLPHVFSPDFSLSPIDSDYVLAVEHTDVAEPGVLDWKDGCARNASGFVQAFNDAGYTDDAEQAFLDALWNAIQRKAHPDTWRDAPGATRWLLLYDQTDTGIFFDDSEAREMLRKAVMTSPLEDGPARAWLVRGSGRVVSVGADGC